MCFAIIDPTWGRFHTKGKYLELTDQELEELLEVNDLDPTEDEQVVSRHTESAEVA